MTRLIRLMRQFALVAGVALLFAMQVRAAPATEIVVTTAADNVADDGQCSLREAILAANSDSPVGGCAGGSGVDTVHFAIPGAGPHTIQLQSPLPVISAPLVINGYSQGGAQENTSPAGEGFNAVLMIVLDGSQVFRMQGLTITGGSSTVRGLVLNEFGDAITLSELGNNRIEGNFIGTDAAGLAPSGSSIGVVVKSSGNHIGGSEPAARNLISGNHNGITIEGEAATFNIVQGNFIGTDRTGTLALENTRNGVDIAWSASGNSIVDNVISGNRGRGIQIESRAADNIVSRNWIGTNPAGDNLGNGLSGIRAVNSGPQIIGGSFTPTGCCEGNIIAYNGRNGVTVSAGGNASWYKGILGNSIYANAGLGIDLGDDGVTPNDPGDVDGEFDANHLQNFPVLNAALITGSDITISGMLHSTALTGFRLEFFANDACDASGYGQGQRFLGAGDVTTLANGDVYFAFTFTETVPGLVEVGQAISSTATTAEGDTSEFSRCVQVGEDAPAVHYLYLPLANRDF
jgi:CSLREA domain-containing protein